MCEQHWGRWRREGRPDIAAFAATTSPDFRGQRPLPECVVPGCRYGRCGAGLCTRHHTDPAALLAEAAARRHELTRAKAIQALRELDRSGRPVTFASVASAAGISRSWLYTQPDIRDQGQRLRGIRNGKPAGAIPASQRATDASLRARLTAALQRNQALAEENARLRRQLARALGDQRATRRGID